LCLLWLALPGTRHLGLVAGLANLVSHLMVQALKRTVVRRRPSAAIPELGALAALPDHYSFPSGHACAAMAIAVAALVVAPPVGGAALALALLVGMSRVYLRVHYMTDVVVGQFLGGATALLIALSLA
jgi:undecaprenyl-diphosphatase